MNHGGESWVDLCVTLMLTAGVLNNPEALVEADIQFHDLVT